MAFRTTRKNSFRWSRNMLRPNSRVINRHRIRRSSRSRARRSRHRHNRRSRSRRHSRRHRKFLKQVGHRRKPVWYRFPPQSQRLQARYKRYLPRCRLQTYQRWTPRTPSRRFCPNHNLQISGTHNQIAYHMYLICRVVFRVVRPEVPRFPKVNGE